MSKRIMNEVICLTEDIGIQMYYQNTDSMHVHRDDVTRLSDAFKTKYNWELISNQLRQFHCDLPGINPDRREPYAVESYFIWKKVYIDKLSTRVYHIRLKGIPTVSIELVINKKFDDCQLTLYKYLFEENSVEFNLLETDVRFSLQSGSIVSKNKFTIKVCFR